MGSWLTTLSKERSDEMLYSLMSTSSRYCGNTIDEENNLSKLSGKQSGSFEVILVHNAMESFQQKVPPVLLGAFEDIFD
jgi:hypothetical protein